MAAPAFFMPSQWMSKRQLFARETTSGRNKTPAHLKNVSPDTT